MVFQNENTDIFIAQRICNELRSGNTEALSELYYKYHVFFSAFARQRLFISGEYPIDNVLSDFWVELLNAKSICAYKGKASLRTYLTLILKRRIIDTNRKIKKEKASGRGHVVSKGTYIGTHGGRVSGVLRDKVIVEEKMKDVTGRLFIQKTALKLNKKSS